MLDDNKRTLLGRISILKDEFINEIVSIINQKEEGKYYGTVSKLSNLKESFTNIIRIKGLSVNEEYLRTQMDVLLAEIKRDNCKSNEELYTWISTRLNRYLDVLQTETDEEEIQRQLDGEKGHLQYEVEENKTQRKRRTIHIAVPKVEGYISDILSNTLRRADTLGIRISNNRFDELRYEISSQLKHKRTHEMEEFLLDEDSELIRIINQKLEEFFEQVDRIMVQGNQEEEKRKTSPNAMMFEHFEIDHKLAQERAIAKSEGIETLPSNVIK